MTILFNLDEHKLFDHVSEYDIEKIAEEEGMSYKEALFYVWFRLKNARGELNFTTLHGAYKQFAKEAVNLLEGRV